MNDTPAGQPATLPAAAVQAAAEVQARYYSAAAAEPTPDAEDLHLARMMLEAAAPHLAAAERERCMPLTVERVNELEAALREVLGRFSKRANVGGMCSSTGWIPDGVVAKWQAVLDGGSGE